MGRRNTSTETKSIREKLIAKCNPKEKKIGVTIIIIIIIIIANIKREKCGSEFTAKFPLSLA